MRLASTFLIVASAVAATMFACTDYDDATPPTDAGPSADAGGSKYSDPFNAPWSASTAGWAQRTPLSPYFLVTSAGSQSFAEFQVSTVGSPSTAMLVQLVAPSPSWSTSMMSCWGTSAR